ncbi:hypothetical protein KR044_006672 [Drosophila immigrans]|nr:hypothetical protein KR044_006672 [Drosophila immigrans]
MFLQPKVEAYFTKAEFVNQFPELLQISHHINRTAENLSALYVQIEFQENMDHLDGVFNLKFQHGKNMVNYSTLELNYCEAFQMVHRHYLVQMIFAELRRVSNLPLKCPFKKNTQYYVNGFTIDTKVIPSYLPQLAFKTDITVLSTGRNILRIILSGQVQRK